MALVLSFVHPLWHAPKKKKHALMHGIYTQIHVYINHCTICLRFVWFKQRREQNKTKQNKANILSWMSCIGWTQSSHKALRGGSRAALSLTGPVVSSLQIIVPCLPERIWLGAQSPLSPSLRYPVLSQMFSHSCKGQWKRFLNLCQHMGRKRREKIHYIICIHFTYLQK